MATFVQQPIWSAKNFEKHIWMEIVPCTFFLSKKMFYAVTEVLQMMGHSILAW